MASLIRRIRRRQGSDRGAELIELAIVLPMLLMVCAAIMDFGFLFQRYEVLTNAAREGARIASLPGYNATDVQDRVDNYLSASGMTGATTTTTYSTQVTSGGASIDVVTVLVTIPSPFVIIGGMSRLVTGGAGGWGTITLRAASVMRLEGS